MRYRAAARVEIDVTPAEDYQDKVDYSIFHLAFQYYPSLNNTRATQSKQHLFRSISEKSIATWHLLVFRL